MKQYKIRQVSKSKKLIKYGITIPNSLIVFYPEGTYFKMENIGNGSILLTSGTQIKSIKQNLERYEYEDVLI